MDMRYKQMYVGDIVEGIQERNDDNSYSQENHQINQSPTKEKPCYEGKHQPNEGESDNVPNQKPSLHRKRIEQVIYDDLCDFLLEKLYSIHPRSLRKPPKQKCQLEDYFSFGKVNLRYFSTS